MKYLVDQLNQMLIKVRYIPMPIVVIYNIIFQELTHPQKWEFDLKSTKFLPTIPPRVVLFILLFLTGVAYLVPLDVEPLFE